MLGTSHPFAPHTDFRPHKSSILISMIGSCLGAKGVGFIVAVYVLLISMFL